MKGRREKKKAKEGNGTEKTIMICSFRKKILSYAIAKNMLLYTENNYLLWNLAFSFPIMALPLNYKPQWEDFCPPGPLTSRHS